MVFSEDTNSYTLEVTTLASPEGLHSGLWLVIAGIDAIPPHIALINNGKYYSVSAKKVDIGTPLENFLKALSRRSTQTIFVKLRKPSSIGEPASSADRDLDGAARLAFSTYPTLGNDNHSCLWPVRDFFAKIFSDKYSKATLVFDLLAMAQQDNLLLECKALFLEPPRLGMEGGAVLLPKYTHEQIREKINSILKVNE